MVIFKTDWFLLFWKYGGHLLPLAPPFPNPLSWIKRKWASKAIDGLVNTPGETIRSQYLVNLLNSFPPVLYNPVVCDLLVPLKHWEAEIVANDVSWFRSSDQECSWKIGTKTHNNPCYLLSVCIYFIYNPRDFKYRVWLLPGNFMFAASISTNDPLVDWGGHLAST